MYEYACTIDKVIDGDTVDCTIDLGFSVWMKHRVRLYGINAPEMTGEGKQAGALAKQALWRLFNMYLGPVTIRTYLDKTDNFGRVLGSFFIGQLNINDEMITQGHAVPYTK